MPGMFNQAMKEKTKAELEELLRIIDEVKENGGSLEDLKEHLEEHFPVAREKLQRYKHGEGWDFDREKGEAIFAENDYVRLIPLTDGDKEFFLKVRRQWDVFIESIIDKQTEKDVCHIIAESSVHIARDDVYSVVSRIAGDQVIVDYKEVPQDANLSKNQSGKIRCGDNGIFKGVPLVMRGEQYWDNIYDFSSGGRVIFTARCWGGEVTSVWDMRNVKIVHIPRSDLSSSSSDDPYNASDYSNAEDFYDDNYYLLCH